MRKERHEIYVRRKGKGDTKRRFGRGKRLKRKQKGNRDWKEE